MNGDMEVAVLRGRYGIGWFIVAWLAIVIVIALAIVGTITVYGWLRG